MDGPRGSRLRRLVCTLVLLVLSTAVEVTMSAPATAATPADESSVITSVGPKLPPHLTKRVKPDLFDCTSRDDRRRKLHWTQVFVKKSAIPIEVTFDNFTAGQNPGDPTDYFFWRLGFDVTYGLNIELKLGVECELSKSVTLFDRKVAQVGPVPIRVVIRPDITFKASAGGALSFKETKHFEAVVERPVGELPQTRAELTMVKPAAWDVDPKLDVEAKVALEFQVFGGEGKSGQRVGLGANISVGYKLSAEYERGCASLVGSIPLELSIFLSLWKSEWDLISVHHDVAPHTLGVRCFTRPTLKPNVKSALLGVYYDARLETLDNRSGRWSITEATMPPGLTLDPGNGRLYGVPSGSPGSRTMRVTFTDIAGQATTSNVTLAVGNPPTLVEDLKGNIARRSDGAAWYVDLRGGLHRIPDGGVYQCLAEQGASPIEVTDADISSLPRVEDAACVRAEPGDVVRTKDGDAYLIDTNWVRHWIPDGNTYDCLRLNGHEIVTPVPRYYVMDLPEGDRAAFDCADAEDARGHVVRADDGSSWYIDLRGSSHWIPNGGTYDCITQQGKSTHPYVVPRRLMGNWGVPREQAQCVRANVGNIIRTSDGDSYVVNDGWTRSWIPDGGSFMCLEVNGHSVVEDVPRYYVMDLQQVGDATLDCYDADAVKGKVVRSSDGKSFYVDKRGGKHENPDGGTFQCVAEQTGGAWAYVVPSVWLTQPQYENAMCVRAAPGNVIRHADGDAYLINSNWTRSWIPNAPVYECLRAKSGGAIGVPRYYIDDLTWSPDASFPTGHCIVRRTDGAAFYVNDQGKREWVPDTPTWDCEIGRGIPVVNATDAVVNSIAETGWHYCLNKANLRGKMLRHADGDVHYIRSDDTRKWVPDEFTYNCRARAGVAVVDTRWREYVNAFPDTGWDYCFDINTFKGKLIRHPDGDMHFVDDRGVRHWVPSSGTASCLSDRQGGTATVRWREYINQIPEGDWAVCGTTLYRNQNFDRGQFLRSSNGAYTLIMQSDANLVLYHGSRAIWASGTNGRAVHHLKLHNNGCMALIDSAGNWLWRPSPDPCNRGGDRLVVQNDGNLVLYAGGTAVWASNTAGR